MPGGRLDHPVDHPQRGRLAAARRPDENGDLAGRCLEVRSSTATVPSGYCFETSSKRIMTSTLGESADNRVPGQASVR